MLYGKKCYIFCLLVIILIPIIEKFYCPSIKVWFLIFIELLFGYFLLLRNAIQKIHGHKLSRYF